MKQKTLLLILVLLSALPANAYDAEINGIYYNFNTSAKTATVTYKDFSYNSYTGYVTIPPAVTYNGATYNVTEIGYRAFYNCSGLTSVTIGNSVTLIGSGAFNMCSSLTSIIIPNSVTLIKDNAFEGTAWYNNQPDGLVYAGKVAYKYKGTMPEDTSITLEEGTLGIADNAFSGCSGLTSITIPNSVTKIGNVAFSSCSKLTSVTIGNGVTSIGIAAFSSCSKLRMITIPNSVTSIGRSAFCECSSLTSVTIPNSVKEMEGNTLNGCSSLTSATIGNSVPSIGDYTFKGCSSLTSVTIGNSVSSIEDYAFYGCSGLTEVYCYAEKVPNIRGVNVFKEVPISSATLHVPATSVDAYKTTAPWSGFGTIVALEPDKKCATPTIEYVDGKLIFDCETEGVEIVSKVTCSDIGDYEGFSVPLTTQYTVTAYAKKEGYEDSDVATKEIEMGTSGLRGDVNQDGEVGMPDVMFIVNYILNGKFPDEE